MPIINVGKVFEAKFGNHTEPKVDVALGGLPVNYSVLKPFHKINVAEDRYKLNLRLNAEQFEEVKEKVREAMDELNKQGGFGASKKRLDEIFAQVIGESTAEGHEGEFRFYGSRKMGFVSRETGNVESINLPCYDKQFNEENLIEGGVQLGPNSVVRSKFTLSLFKKDNKVFLNVHPVNVVVLKLVEPPKRESVGHDGLDDTAYDY